MRQNIERSCELIARGKLDFNAVVQHALSIFKNKFNYFKLSIGTMEKLMTIIRMTRNASANKEMLLQWKIPRGDDSQVVNFCIKCFNGQFCIDYTKKKGWGMKCNSEKCQFKIGFLSGAGLVVAVKEKCPEC